MIIKTIVPKIGEPMHYLGKPVNNDAGVRIGGITDVVEVDGHYELTMDIPDEMRSELAREIHSMSVKAIKESDKDVFCMYDHKR